MDLDRAGRRRRRGRALRSRARVRRRRRVPDEPVRARRRAPAELLLDRLQRPADEKQGVVHPAGHRRAGRRRGARARADADRAVRRLDGRRRRPACPRRAPRAGALATTRKTKTRLVDADVLQLVREERLLEAARLCSERGDAAGASALFERACDWRSAATEALRAGDAAPGPRARAARRRRRDRAKTARRSRRTEPLGAQRAAAHLVGTRAPLPGRRACSRRRDAISTRRSPGSAPASRFALRRSSSAPASRRTRHARSRRASGAIRSDGAAAVALGALLLRFGRDEAAVRALQRVPAAGPRAARGLHAPASMGLQRLGLAVGGDRGGGGAGCPRRRQSSPPPVAQPANARGACAGSTAATTWWRQVASSARARVLEGFDRARGERVAVKVYAPATPRGPGSRRVRPPRGRPSRPAAARSPRHRADPRLPARGPHGRPCLDGRGHARADARAGADRAGARRRDRGVDPRRRSATRTASASCTAT